MGESSRTSGVRASGRWGYESGFGDRSACVSRRDFLFGSAALVTGFLMRGSVASAQEAERVRVGFIISGRKENVRETDSLIAGFDLFLKEHGSPPLEVLKKHGGEKDEKTPEALAEILVRDEVRFLIGPTTLLGSEKCIHGLANTKAILFLTSPCVRLVAGELCVPSAFRLRATTFQSSKPLAAWALKNLGMNAFMTGTDDSQGNEEADFFAYGFEKSGGMFVNRVMSPPDSQDLAAIIESIGSTKPDFVFASFRGTDAATFLKKFQSSLPMPRPPVIGPGSLTTFPEPLKNCGEACLKVRTLTTLKDPVEFTKRIRKQTGREISDVARAAEGYDIAHVIHEASRHLKEVPTNMTELIQRIEQIEIEGPQGKIRFDKNHESVVEVRVAEWEISKGTLQHKIVAELGPCSSLDFGCGRVGFPKKPVTEPEDDSGADIDQE